MSIKLDYAGYICVHSAKDEDFEQRISFIDDCLEKLNSDYRITATKVEGLYELNPGFFHNPLKDSYVESYSIQFGRIDGEPFDLQEMKKEFEKLGLSDLCSDLTKDNKAMFFAKKDGKKLNKLASDCVAALIEHSDLDKDVKTAVVALDKYYALKGERLCFFNINEKEQCVFEADKIAGDESYISRQPSKAIHKNYFQDYIEYQKNPNQTEQGNTIFHLRDAVEDFYEKRATDRMRLVSLTKRENLCKAVTNIVSEKSLKEFGITQKDGILIVTPNKLDDAVAAIKKGNFELAEPMLKQLAEEQEYETLKQNEEKLQKVFPGVITSGIKDSKTGCYEFMLPYDSAVDKIKKKRSLPKKALIVGEKKSEWERGSNFLILKIRPEDLSNVTEELLSKHSRSLPLNGILNSKGRRI
jgi:hypothetical protein